MSHQEVVIGSSEWTEERSPAVARYAWVIVTVVLLASVAASLNQFKGPPLIPVLMEAFQLDLSQAGALMSVFALAGPLLFGIFVQSLGWAVAGYWLIPVAILGFAASWMVRVR